MLTARPQTRQPIGIARDFPPRAIRNQPRGRRRRYPPTASTMSPRTRAQDAARDRPKPSPEAVTVLERHGVEAVERHRRRVDGLPRDLDDLMALRDQQRHERVAQVIWARVLDTGRGRRSGTVPRPSWCPRSRRTRPRCRRAACAHALRIRERQRPRPHAGQRREDRDERRIADELAAQRAGAHRLDELG